MSECPIGSGVNPPIFPPIKVGNPGRTKERARGPEGSAAKHKTLLRELEQPWFFNLLGIHPLFVFGVPARFWDRESRCSENGNARQKRAEIETGKSRGPFACDEAIRGTTKPIVTEGEKSGVKLVESGSLFVPALSGQSAASGT